MAQFNKNTQDFLNQERTLFEVNMVANKNGDVVTKTNRFPVDVLPANACPSGYKLEEKETESCSGRILCEIGITQPTTTTTRQCVQESNTWLWIAGIALIVVAILSGLLLRKRGKKR